MKHSKVYALQVSWYLFPYISTELSPQNPLHSHVMLQNIFKPADIINFKSLQLTLSYAGMCSGFEEW